MNINELIGYQPIDPTGEPAKLFQKLNEILAHERDKDPRWLMLKAYTLGYIEGKRAERSRKQKSI